MLGQERFQWSGGDANQLFIFIWPKFKNLCFVKFYLLHFLRHLDIKLESVWCIEPFVYIYWGGGRDRKLDIGTDI